MLRYIPNALTLFRIALTPVILLRIMDRDFPAAVRLFFIAGMTDTIDGTLARRFRWQTKLGAILDPLADKLLLTTVFLALAAVGAVPVWLTAIVLGRDLAILLAAGLLRWAGKLGEFPPSVWGKISTLCQLLTAGAVLLGWPPDPLPFFVATVLLTGISGLHYAVTVAARLR